MMHETSGRMGSVRKSHTYQAEHMLLIARNISYQLAVTSNTTHHM